MKRFILIALSIFAISVATTAPALALTDEFQQAWLRNLDAHN